MSSMVAPIQLIAYRIAIISLPFWGLIACGDESVFEPEAEVEVVTKRVNHANDEATQQILSAVSEQWAAQGLIDDFGDRLNANAWRLYLDAEGCPAGAVACSTSPPNVLVALSPAPEGKRLHPIVVHEWTHIAKFMLSGDADGDHSDQDWGTWCNTAVTLSVFSVN